MSQLFTIEKYSEKAIAVFFVSSSVAGQYFSLLTELGGKQNDALKGATPNDPRRSGWIFSAKREEEIRNKLTAYQASPPSSSLSSLSLNSVKEKKVTFAPSTSAGVSIESVLARLEVVETELAALKKLLLSSSSSLSQSSCSNTTSTKSSKKKREVAESDEELDDEEPEAKREVSLIKRR